MPMPNLSLSAPSNATSGASGDLRTTSTAGSGGFRQSPLVNIAFPGANLSATASAEGSPRIGAWLWWLAGLLGLAGLVWFIKRGRAKR